MQQRIRSGLSAVLNLQHVASLCTKVEEDISNLRFYHALRTLDQVQRVHLRHTGGGALTQALEAYIPRLRTQIKKRVIEDFNDWMVCVRQQSGAVGAFAMKQVSAQLAQERAMNPLRRTVDGWKVEEAPSQTAQSSADDAHIVEEGLFEHVKVDFSSLYRCIHIHEHLGARAEFQEYYRENRRLQSHLVLQPVKEHTLEGSEPYFHQIAGFFIVESTVLETTPLVPRGVVEGLWDYAVAKIKAVLQEQFAYCSSPEVLSQVKAFVFNFAATLHSYSYDVSSLLAFLDAIKEKYAELSIDKFTKTFTDMVVGDNYAPLAVTTQEDYDKLIVQNKLQEASPDGVAPHSKPEFPQSFPFSAVLPQYYTLVRQFISEFYEFANDLSDTDEYLIKSSDQLIKQLCQAVVASIEQAGTVPQLVQSLVNTSYMLRSCDYFGDYLGRWTRAGGRVKLTGSRKALEAATILGERRICALSESKLDELISTSANINWTPSSTTTDPRDYVEALILYLETTLAFIYPLAAPLQEDITSKAFKRIAEGMLTLLLGTPSTTSPPASPPVDSFKRFNLHAIQNLNVDLTAMESFAKSKSTSKNLVVYFAELRQLINLLLAENCEEFLDSKIHSKNYPLLTNTPQLIGLLQKYKEESHGFLPKKEEKVRAKHISTLAKKLKDISN